MRHHRAAPGRVRAAVVARLPRRRFDRPGPHPREVDRHHDRIRFAWRFVDPAGEPLLDGIDVCTVADDVRLASFTVFFGPLVDAG